MVHVIIVGALFVLLLIVAVCINKITDWYDRRKHPELHDKLVQLKRELDEYQRAHIIGVMQTIDRQLEERKYVPRDELEAFDAMLDVLRRDLRDNKREYNRMEYEYYKESKK